MERQNPASGGLRNTNAPPSSAPSSSTPTPSSAPMAAPAIPNLLSRLGTGPRLRGGRRGQRGGLRGAAHGLGPGQHPGHSGHPGARAMDHDAVIQSTDSDAALSRLSAVELGLLDDLYAQYFVSDGGPAVARLPIINRGTYTRTSALDTIIGSFLADTTASTEPQTRPRRQIVSLGAGTDTRSLRMLSQASQADKAFAHVAYHEIDFPAVCTRKRSIIQSVPALRSLCTEPPVPVTETGPSWRASLGRGNQLWGHGLDLRQLARQGRKEGEAEEEEREKREGPQTASLAPLAGLHHDVPTLLVSECCLCYLQVPEAMAVLRWFSDRIPQLGVVLYEAIRPFDAFGRTMTANLLSRGLSMPTVAVYEDGSAQETRLRQQVGLERAGHAAIDTVWADWVSANEKNRINELNALDEEEEWQLLASHYVIAWGSRGDAFDASWEPLPAPMTPVLPSFLVVALLDATASAHPSSSRAVSHRLSLSSAFQGRIGPCPLLCRDRLGRSDPLDHCGGLPLSLPHFLDTQTACDWALWTMADKDGKQNKYRQEIQQMMYVSGETGEPSVETLGMIEEIVRQQVVELLRSCTELAARRGSRSITITDLIFQIRHDAPKVSRLRTFLSWKDVRKNVKDSDDKGAEVDIGGGEDVVGAPVAGAAVEETAKKNKKNKLALVWEPVSFFNQEVPEREDEEDEEEEEMNHITLQRLRKADERTKAMTREEYVTWSDYRQASFTYRKGKRFREWAGFGIVTDSKPSDDIVDILGFLTFEMVQTLTEEALRIKDHEDQWKERTGEGADEAAGPKKKRKLAQGLFNLPSEGRTPVEPRHIQEAFRRLQARQTKYHAMLNGTRLSAKNSLKIF